MRDPRHVALVFTGFVLALHGFAHMPGALGSLELATFDDVSYQPNLLLTDAGDGLMRVIGVFWVLAALAFVVAGTAVVVRRTWAPRSIALAVVASLPLTTLWYQDAVIGLALNIAVLVSLLAWMAGDTLWSRRHPEPGAS